MRNEARPQRNLRRAIVAFTVVTMGVAAMAGQSLAQDEEEPQYAAPQASCSDPIWSQSFSPNRDGIPLADTVSLRRPAFTSYSFAADVPAGEYLVEMVTYDGYLDRPESVQDQESLAVSFRDAAAAEIVSTGLTTDLADAVVTAAATSALGSVILDRDAATVVFVHSSQINGAGGANSVAPVALCLALVEPPPTPTPEPTPEPTTQPTAQPTAQPTPTPAVLGVSQTLPRTGAGTPILIGFAVAMVAGGLCLQRMGSKIGKLNAETE
jgi:hypothetical protein